MKKLIKEILSNYKSEELTEEQATGLLEILLTKKEQAAPKPVFKAGEEVKIIGCTHGHFFEIGEVVTLDSYDSGRYDWKASNSKGFWYVLESEIEKI